MNRTVIQHLFVCCSLAALSGCQLLGNLHLTRSSQDRAKVAEVAITSGTAVQDGRDHLRGGRPGLAIEAFNRALASGQDPAASYNGLGVAYARLGRTDLAFRFFKKAALSEPDNAAYSRNLTRLIDSPQFALAMMTQAAPVAAAPAPASASASATATPALPAPQGRNARIPGRLQRDGNHQFSLTTLPSADEVSPAARRSAGLAQCPRSKLRGKRVCAAVMLPQIENRRPAEVAIASPVVVPAALPAALPAAAAAAAAAPEPAAPALSPAGKRRTIQFGQPPASAPYPRTRA